MHDVIKERRADLTRQSQYGLTVAELDLILRWLLRRFDLLTLREYLVGCRRGILLTFDDGKANNFHNLLPLLERYNVPAVLFVSTQHIVDPKDWLPYTRWCAQTQWPDLRDVPDEVATEYLDGMAKEQIALCASHPLITLGAHTVSHPFLTRCDPSTVQYELKEAKRQLEEWSGRTIEAFAYPTGDYNRWVAEAVQAAGYKYAFAVRSKHIGMPQYELPRIHVGDFDLRLLDAKLSGLFQRPVRIQMG